MNRRLTLFGLLLLLAGVLALVASGLIGEALIVPLLYLLWLARLLITSVPQAVIWSVLLLLALPLLWRSLARPQALRLRATSATTPRAPVLVWTELFLRAERDQYGRWQLAQRLSQLAFELLANQEQREAANPWRVLQDKTLALPDDVRAYLQAGARPLPTVPMRWRWFTRPQAAAPYDPLDLDPEVVLRFLENYTSGDRS